MPDRRTFLKLAASGALSAWLPASIARALEIPAHHRTGSLMDVEHIVVLMQENRSFDHYFGTLRGVRGFGDPRAVRLPNGDSVWYQPARSGGYVLPFRPQVADAGLSFIEDTDHTWNVTHAALDGGWLDQWVVQKGTTTMAYLNRQDIPFHYALADAFTICDDYHCSVFGPTHPNRYHMWTGWVGNDGRSGGPAVDNARGDYHWTTYPERLTAAGISWRVYQDVGNRSDLFNAYIGNNGDNSLLQFRQYRNALPGTALYERALTGTDISTIAGTNAQVAPHLVDQFRADVLANRLPQVSYIVAPEAYSEHPNWPANWGAWYIAQFLDALTANPEVWSRTVLLLTWDENDGFFDHKTPPTPPMSRAQGLSTVATTNEIFPGNATYEAAPYGLGLRVPMLVISPWSKGGYVSSEVFDHTSIIRLMEARWAETHPGLMETNITPWRRAVAGDLTSAFNFRNPNAKVVALPSTAAYLPPNQNRYPDYAPPVPTDQTMPTQEPGTRPARPLPYDLNAFGSTNGADGTFSIEFVNAGKAAVLQVRPGNSSLGPWTYTVGEGAHLSDTWPITRNNLTGYDLSVYGPNGFLRAFRGRMSGARAANLDVRAAYDREGNAIRLIVTNRGSQTVTLQIRNAYTGRAIESTLRPHARARWRLALERTWGWYDVIVEVEQDPTFRWQMAGHIENGRESRTDPAISAR